METEIQNAKKTPTTYKIGLIEVAIWENKTKDDKSFKTLKMSRSYQDAEKKWQKTEQFSLSEIGQLIALLQVVQQTQITKKE